MQRKKLNLVKEFVALIKSRSAEHETAITRLHDLPGAMASILRQELDSMVRVLYLLSISDQKERERLIQATMQGDKWKIRTCSGKYKVVKDSDMVEIAEKFQGWSRSVYKFGCAFIHLSCFHGYVIDDPLRSLAAKERDDILGHMRYYHGGPSNDNPSFRELAIYFPSVFKKIQGNLECYLKDLEEGRSHHQV